MNDIQTHTDLQSFWMAIERSLEEPALLVRSLEETYFVHASDSLRHYIEFTRLTAERLAAVYWSRHEYYDALREREKQLHEAARALPSLHSALMVDLPHAVPADLAVVIGDFSYLGTVAPRTILLGLEFFPSSTWRHLIPVRLPCLSTEDLGSVLAHELIHVQQLERFPEANVAALDLLQLALLEGAAEYVGERLSQRRSTLHPHAFGQAHAAEIWTAFNGDLEQGTAHGWFYNDATRSGWPRDVGYYVGYELCRAYHADHVHDPQVVEANIYGFLTPEPFKAYLAFQS